jgi:hypothetical protein
VLQLRSADEIKKERNKEETCMNVARREVVTATSLKIPVFWDAAQCGIN